MIHSLTGSIHQLWNDDFEMVFSVYKTYSLETWLLCLYQECESSRCLDQNQGIQTCTLQTKSYTSEPGNGLSDTWNLSSPFSELEKNIFSYHLIFIAFIDFSLVGVLIVTIFFSFSQKQMGTTDQWFYLNIDISFQ